MNEAFTDKELKIIDAIESKDGDTYGTVAKRVVKQMNDNYGCHVSGIANWITIIDLFRKTLNLTPQWQPIETAPKDTVILITDGSLTYAAYFQADQEYDWKILDERGCENAIKTLDAVGWQPLPEPKQ